MVTETYFVLKCAATTVYNDAGVVVDVSIRCQWITSQAFVLRRNTNMSHRRRRVQRRIVELGDGGQVSSKRSELTIQSHLQWRDNSANSCNKRAAESW
jgi:hypothetical protein